MVILNNVGFIDNIQNLHIIETYDSGENELVFEISLNHEHYKDIFEEMQLSYASQHYVIKSIDEQEDCAVISCRLDLDLLQMNAVIDYREENQHLYALLNFALTGTGWSYLGADRISSRRTVELVGGNALDLLRLAQTTYRAVFLYNTKNKVLTVVPLDSFEYKGEYFTDELNISKMLLRGDSFDYATRLIPIGAEGLRINDINNGISYVENFEYSSKIITKVWKDENYTDAQALKDDAIEKLKVLSKPNRTYSLDVIDLASINSEYSNLSFKIGDKVMMIDRNRNIKVEHQVTKLTSYPDKPQLNKAELCATAKGFESVVKNLTGLINGTNVAVNIQGRKISQMTLDIEAFTLELSNYYTIGETETYIGAQIKATADEISLTVTEQQNHIKTLTGEIETVSEQTASLQIQANGIQTTVSNHTGNISTITQTVDNIETVVNNQAGAISSLSLTTSNFTAAFQTVGASGYTRTGKTVINAYGLTVYDGALKIYDSSSNLIFDASSSGVIYAKGSFRSSGVFNGNTASASLIAGGIIMYVGDSTVVGAQLYCGSTNHQVVLEERQGYEIVIAHATTTAGETWFAWGGNVRYQFGYDRAIFSGDLTLGGTLRCPSVQVSNTYGLVVEGHTFYCNLTNILGVDRYILIANP